MKKDITMIFTSNLIKMLVTLITICLIPMVLSVENYGYLKLYTFYASYIGISHLGYCDGVYLKYGGVDIASINNRQIRSEWATLLFYEAVISFIIVVTGLIYRDLIIICLGTTVIPTVLFTFYTYIYQATGDFVHYTQIMNISTVFSLLVNLILVVFKIRSYQVYVISYVSLNVFSFLIGSTSFKKHGWLDLSGISFNGISFNVLETMIKSGFLLMVGNFAYTLFIGIDKWFIKLTMKITDFSMYSFACQLLTVVNMFITPISMTLYSHISRKKDKIFEIKIKRTLLVFLMIFPLAAYGLTFTIKYFMKQYILAIKVVSILLISQIFLSLNLSIFINMYKTYKRQKEYFLRLLCALCIAVLLDFIVYLIQPNIIGYAFATLLSCFVWLGLNIQYFPHLAPDNRELRYVAMMIGTYILTFLVDNEILELGVYTLLYLLFTKLLMEQEWSYAVEVGKNAIQKLSCLICDRDSCND